MYYNDETKDKNLQVDLNDPFEILDVLDKMLKLTTVTSSHNYIRKIICSVNLLQRKIFPDKINDKFDPDKVYERILNHFNGTEALIAKQKIIIESLKKK